MSGTETVSNNKYYSVVGGEFKTRTTESDPKGVERVNKNGVHVFEVPHKAVFGRIEGVSLFSGEFGKSVNITLDPDEDGKNPVLSFNVESAEGKDILVKLPNIKAGEEVRFMPYRFTPDGEEKERSGLSLHTKDDEGKFTVKVGNFFLDDKTPLHGYPTIDWEKSSESDRKIYFIKRDEFLLNYLQEKVIPTFAGEKSVTKGYDYPEISPEDVAF